MAEEKKRTNPSDTKQSGFSIIVPTHEFGSQPSVYKVFFGRKYLIWKGKALLQSCELIAKGISAWNTKLNQGIEMPETDYLYHVIKHIRSTRCTSARADVISCDFEDEFGALDGLKVLKLEQQLLDEATGDLLCLNNNVQAYVPVNNTWLTQTMKNKFNKWYKERRK